MNLLSNAIKYTPKGGDVWYDVRYEPNTETTGTFTFIIKDNGIGMSEDFQKKMFESFTQEKPNTKTAEGTGLGLYIAKRYVDLMNGTITVKSASGKGSVFTVTIQSEVKHVTQVEKEVNHNYDFTGVHILLAEDNIFNQEIAKTLLNEKGALVDVAENGQEAVDRFCASAPGWYKAVFMDIHMPVLNGFEATQIIRAMERSDAAKIPIIAMTADAYDQDVKNCLDHGMNAHVAKPIDTEQLYSQLDQLLQKEKESAS